MAKRSDKPEWRVRRVPHPSSHRLADLIDSPETFKADVVFREPLVTKAADLDRLPTAEELWDDLLTRSPRQPEFRLVKAGSTTNRGGITRSLGFGNRRLNDLVDANAVINRYREGDTVVLQGLQYTDPSLARLATNLALDVDHPIQINAYLSPPGERGLDIHFDFHDVFVIQLAGSKRWTIWDRLRRTIDPVKAGATVAKPEAGELGAPRLELTLTPGDVLYLPRGFPHAAETTHESSDHITIGLTAVTWHRYLRKALEAAVGDPAVRASLPVDLLSSDAPPPPPLPRTPSLAEVSDTIEFRHWMAREIWRRMPQTRLYPRNPVPLDDRFYAIAPGPLLWLTEIDNRAVIGLGDRILDMPTVALPLLRNLLAATDSFTTDSLGAFDYESRDAVLRRLIAEGVLIPAGG